MHFGLKFNFVQLSSLDNKVNEKLWNGIETAEKQFVATELHKAKSD